MGTICIRSQKVRTFFENILYKAICKKVRSSHLRLKRMVYRNFSSFFAKFFNISVSAII